MAVPTKYNPSYSYSGFESASPASPKPGAQLDNDFAQIEQAIDETIDALGEIRRSDGALANGIVGPDQLSAALVMGFTVQGAWVTATEYKAADGVTYGTSFYKARVAHTAAPATRPDLSPTTWALLFTFDSIAVGDNAITTVKIADGAVTGPKIADGVVSSAKMADASVTNAKLAQIATSTIKGRVTAATGVVEDLTAANVKSILELAKADVGLGDVDNTTDATKFAATAGRVAGRNRQTGTTYAFVLADAGKLVEGNNAATQTYTVPPNSSAAFTVDQTVINVGQYGAGQISIAAGAGVTIRSSGSKLKLTGQYSTASLVKIGTDEWWLFGDLAA